jgi:hypothetical protein
MIKTQKRQYILAEKYNLFMNNLVIISNWLDKGTKQLDQLLMQITKSDPGVKYDLLVVSNLSNISIFKIEEIKFVLMNHISNIISKSLFPPDTFDVLIRENIGMNIGAWQDGWLKMPNFENYLFLQDEVILLKDNWFICYINKLNFILNNNSNIFLIGESINNRWNCSWEDLRMSALNTKAIGHPNNINRVDFYLAKFNEWSINPGAVACHLRSLIWFTNNKTMNEIKGFKIGKSYGECIAAEIAASLSVISKNGIVRQLDNDPFKNFYHPDWRKDGISKL